MNDIPSLDQIKYNFKGKSKIYFGTVNRYHPESKKSWEDGLLLINDPINGTLKLVKYNDIEIEGQKYGWEKTDPETNMPIDSEFARFVNDAYKEHLKASKNATEGVVKDKLFSTHVGDGSAFYVVTKVSKRSVRIEWRNFSPDSWVDQTFGYGGAFPISCVEGHVLHAEAMMKLFAPRA